MCKSWGSLALTTKWCLSCCAVISGQPWTTITGESSAACLAPLACCSGGGQGSHVLHQPAGTEKAGVGGGEPANRHLETVVMLVTCLFLLLPASPLATSNLRGGFARHTQRGARGWCCSPSTRSLHTVMGSLAPVYPRSSQMHYLIHCIDARVTTIHDSILRADTHVAATATILVGCLP